MLWEILLSLIVPAAVLVPSLSSMSVTSHGAALPVVDSVSVEAFSPQSAPFAVRFGDARNDYRVMAMFVLPNETVPVAVENPQTAYAIRPTAGTARETAPGAWSWVAPSRPGVYPVEIRSADSTQSMTLNVFVMVPFTRMRNGRLDGYRIGRYAAPRTFYARPEGFVQVTRDMMDIAVAPHFRLGQFVCKQPGGPPQYLVLRQPLLVKLEQLLAEVNDRGRPATTFTLMSAYRTPWYNAAIGNETRLSRHQYGDAADIFVDADGDGRMDDLNHDGRSTLADAHWLGQLVSEAEREPEFAGLTGGLGTYEPTREHGPFVHVDVRGFDARWGV